MSQKPVYQHVCSLSSLLVFFYQTAIETLRNINRSTAARCTDSIETLQYINNALCTDPIENSQCWASNLEIMNDTGTAWIKLNVFYCVYDSTACLKLGQAIDTDGAFYVEDTSHMLDHFAISFFYIVFYQKIIHNYILMRLLLLCNSYECLKINTDYTIPCCPHKR